MKCFRSGGASGAGGGDWPRYARRDSLASILMQPSALIAGRVSKTSADCEAARAQPYVLLPDFARMLISPLLFFIAIHGP